MSKPVYVLVLAKDPTELYRQLPPDERQALVRKAIGSRDQAGGKDIVACDARWSSQQWMGFSVEEYPSVDALQEHMKRLAEMQWWRYGEFTTILGTTWEGGA